MDSFTQDSFTQHHDPLSMTPAPWTMRMPPQGYPQHEAAHMPFESIGAFTEPTDAYQRNLDPQAESLTPLGPLTSTASPLKRDFDGLLGPGSAVDGWQGNIPPAKRSRPLLYPAQAHDEVLAFYQPPPPPPPPWYMMPGQPNPYGYPDTTPRYPQAHRVVSIPSSSVRWRLVGQGQLNSARNGGTRHDPAPGTGLISPRTLAPVSPESVDGRRRLKRGLPSSSSSPESSSPGRPAKRARRGGNIQPRTAGLARKDIQALLPGSAFPAKGDSAEIMGRWWTVAEEVRLRRAWSAADEARLQSHGLSDDEVAVWDVLAGRRFRCAPPDLFRYGLRFFPRAEPAQNGRFWSALLALLTHPFWERTQPGCSRDGDGEYDGPKPRADIALVRVVLQSTVVERLYGGLAGQQHLSPFLFGPPYSRITPRFEKYWEGDHVRQRQREDACSAMAGVAQFRFHTAVMGALRPNGPVGEPVWEFQDALAAEFIFLAGDDGHGDGDGDDARPWPSAPPSGVPVLHRLQYVLEPEDPAIALRALESIFPADGDPLSQQATTTTTTTPHSEDTPHRIIDPTLHARGRDGKDDEPAHLQAYRAEAAEAGRARRARTHRSIVVETKAERAEVMSKKRLAVLAERREGLIRARMLAENDRRRKLSERQQQQQQQQQQQTPSSAWEFKLPDIPPFDPDTSFDCWPRMREMMMGRRNDAATPTAAAFVMFPPPAPSERAFLLRWGEETTTANTTSGRHGAHPAGYSSSSSSSSSTDVRNMLSRLLESERRAMVADSRLRRPGHAAAESEFFRLPADVGLLAWGGVGTAEQRDPFGRPSAGRGGKLARWAGRKWGPDINHHPKAGILMG